MFRSVRVRFGVTFILAIFAIGVDCCAQISKVNAEDLMDSVLDMKKAAAIADKLTPDGSKYCHWGVASFDASDLDSVVSRLLLSHGSVVPDEISASKMWRVSLVADDLIDQLEMRLQDCNLGMRLSPDIHSVAIAGKPVLSKLQDAKHRFARQAFQQTEWQEWSHAKLFFPSKPDTANNRLGAPAVGVNEILGASLEVRGAWEDASKVIIEATDTKECLTFGPSDKRIEAVELDKLIDRVSSVSPPGSYVPAADMWLVAITTETPRLAVQYALEACGYNALWKKKAKRVADAAVGSDHRLKAAVAKLNALALKQTEWEEQAFQKQTMIQEQ
jgi:hypothetical protein